MMNTHAMSASETVTIMVSPYQTARGDLVSRGPLMNEATIRVGDKLLHGECLPLVTARSAAQTATCAV